ncbi:AT-hook motif nuclear-localized protein 7-like isoform X1 [Syzygium oleosum]|uniref:AT-hook motif nuclear-localized protein 7-like isoform X1 n=1 Tax=Syzygium oleosum TaxID=219896 RepID=UPI0024B8DEAE|nr:AT-hook motif nuclear-localized protein 7-like isoform X1 [Syzygium oleosum]
MEAGKADAAAAAAARPGSTGNGSSAAEAEPPPPPPPPRAVVVPEVMTMAVNMSVGRTLLPLPSEAAPPAGAVGVGGEISSFGQAKKRGRPRKYDSEGNLILSPSSPSFGLSSSPPRRRYRVRGRGRGNGNWQFPASLGELFASTAGGDFTPHVVTVNTGEDVAGKIMTFAQGGARGICVLSANGAVSNVTIRQPGSSGGLLTYEGRFEILSLSGSFTFTDCGGVKSRTGGLSVSLAGPDGRVIGGGMAGLLVAASPIQVVIGSFTPNGYKPHKRKYTRRQGIAPAPTAMGRPDAVQGAAPISQLKPDHAEISFAQAEPDCKTDEFEPIEIPNTDTPDTEEEWDDPEPALTPDQGPYPDINVSVPGD